MDITGLLLSIATKPEVLPLLLGGVVKMVVDFLKKQFKKVDEEGTVDGYKVQVQLLVMACTLIAAWGQLALQHKLGDADPTTLTNFLMAVLPIFLSALGVQKVGNIVTGKEKEVKELIKEAKKLK